MAARLTDARDPRIRKGLIPLLIALRVQAERERKLKDEAEDGEPAAKPKRTRGWFG
jgi:hypothetical protein